MVSEYVERNLARTLLEGGPRTVFWILLGRGERFEVGKETVVRIFGVQRPAGYVACATGGRNDLLVKLFHLAI